LATRNPRQTTTDVSYSFLAERFSLTFERLEESSDELVGVYFALMPGELLDEDQKSLEGSTRQRYLLSDGDELQERPFGSLVRVTLLNPMHSVR
jgi:hypothetical protein